MTRIFTLLTATISRESRWAQERVETSCGVMLFPLAGRVP